MTKAKQPRVAAIGLNDFQKESIAHLCGDLRSAYSLTEYLQSYSWTETDVVVASDMNLVRVDRRVNLLTFGTCSFIWSDYHPIMGGQTSHRADTRTDNTERELTIPSSCPALYRSLAAELSRTLGQSDTPPPTIRSSRQDRTSLIETTSGHPVALRFLLPVRSEESAGSVSRPVSLLLPEVPNLAAWFRAFMADIHDSDPDRVPHAPPRLSQPSDWYTAEERALANQITEIDSELERLKNERFRLQVELAAAGEKADSGIRRILCSDGDELVAAAKDVLSGLGFEVRDMDEELEKDEPKREDLRLTITGNPNWEAVVEVKGYPNGTKTNDGQQIRTHRDRYIKEKGRYPSVTIWLANEHRTMDPSSRPSPGPQVEEAAELVGAVHVLSTDLYRQWSLVAAGKLDKELVIKSLVDASPGLWTPPVADTST